MANQKHLERLMKGTSVWNRWRTQHREEYLEPDLSGANLRDTDLRDTDLRDTDLRDTDLSGAALNTTNCQRADFTEANLSRANLSWADFTEANLSRANLTEAYLAGTNFTYAKLDNTNMREAEMWATLFTNVDLSTVKGLDTMSNHGPSIISIDTIYRSQGKIPERFLREVGVPDSFLEYMHSLIGQPIRYFTCFISHSHHDQRFCDRLYADLRHHDVPSWYFPEDATWGKTIYGEIDRSIKLYDKLVLVCSEHSLQSPAVLREIERALQREDHEGKNILFPIRLDNYLFHQWEHERKADVVYKIAGDFRGWESSAEKYEKAFQQFLKALKAEEAA